MKKTTIKRLIAFAFISLFICSLTFSGLAIPSRPNNVNDIINLYKSDNIEYEIIDSYPLSSFSGKQIYTLYTLNPYGYAILLDETASLVEACYSENTVLPIDLDSQSSYYYGGPGVYCIETIDGFYNIFDGRYLTAAEKEAALDTESSMYAYEVQKCATLAKNDWISLATTESSNDSTEKSYSVGYSYFSTLSDFGFNREGSCTVIAIAILLGYYDYYNNDDIIDSAYEDGKGTSEDFHQLLNSYVYGDANIGGISIGNAAIGVNEYLSDRGMNMKLVSENSNASTAILQMIEMLKNGEPVVASMGTSKGALWNHSVLVYKVQYDEASPVSTAVVTFNMGWHTEETNGQKCKSYVASAGWFYVCGYIENTCTSHNMTQWRNYNTTVHRKNCAKCTYIQDELHSKCWDSTLGKCMRCGRTGNISVPII